MSAASFVAELGPYAAEAAHATGLDCRLFLVQWALESAFGTSEIASHNNFAGIENSAGKGCTVCDGIFTCCPTIADFEALYVAILEQAAYAGVRATAGQSLATQFHALGASPWAASHYATGCGVDGCELANLYAADQALFDGAHATYCLGINPCLGVTCDACSTCVAGVCVSHCPNDEACVAGVCTPLGPPPGLGGAALLAGAVIVGGIATLAVLEARRRPPTSLGRGTVAHAVRAPVGRAARRASRSSPPAVPVRGLGTA